MLPSCMIFVYIILEFLNLILTLNLIYTFLNNTTKTILLAYFSKIKKT